MPRSSNYRLYLVTDQSVLTLNSPNLSLDKAVEQAILGGITMVQLREKTLNSKAFFEQALTIKQICHAHNVPLLINDRVDIALAINADGVHIGQEDLPADVVRKMIGNDKIVGVTAKTIEQAQVAEAQGADYLGVGAVFGTTTKPNAKALSVKDIAEICQSVKIPVVAIGGITAENVAQLKNTGIQGVAVVSGILGKPDIELASRELNHILTTILS